MDLAALCGTNGHHLAVFSVDAAFSCQFVAIRLPLTLPSYRGVSGIGYASKKLSKMAGNSARYPLSNW